MPWQFRVLRGRIVHNFIFCSLPSTIKPTYIPRNCHVDPLRGLYGSYGSTWQLCGLHDIYGSPVKKQISRNGVGRWQCYFRDNLADMGSSWQLRGLRGNYGSPVNAMSRTLYVLAVTGLSWQLRGLYGSCGPTWQLRQSRNCHVDPLRGLYGSYGSTHYGVYMAVQAGLRGSYGVYMTFTAVP